MLITDATYRVSLMERADKDVFQNALKERFLVRRIAFEDDGRETEISLVVQDKLHDTQVMFYLPDHIDLLSSGVSYKEDGQ